MLKNLYTKIAGDPSEKTVKGARVVVEEEINPLEPELEKLTDAELHELFSKHKLTIRW